MAMHTLLRLSIVGGLGLVLGLGPRSAGAVDAPLTGPPVATFGPARLDVIVAGAGLESQPASFDVTIPDGADVVAGFLYVTGRGSGDPDVVVNGAPVALPLVASAGPLPFDPSQSTETRRVELTGDLAGVVGPGTSTLTVEGYDQAAPGGAFVVVVVTHPEAPMRTISLLDGADYAFHDFAAPFGPDTEVGRLPLVAADQDRTAELFLVTHDTEPERPDAARAFVGSGAVPVTLVDHPDALLLEVDRLGVPTSAGGFTVGSQLDILATDVTVPVGAEFVAFQVESPEGGPLPGDSTVLCAAILAVSEDDGGVNPPPPPPGGGDPVCGDGTVHPGELCDDGNTIDGDGCSALCEPEGQLMTWDVLIRLRTRQRDTVTLFTMIPGLPGDAVGSEPVEVTLKTGDRVLASVAIPTGGWSRIGAEATPAFPDGRRAIAKGRIGGLRVQHLKLFPMEDKPMYNLKLRARGDVLGEPLGVTHVTTIVRVGARVYSTTDRMVLRRFGRALINELH